MKYSLATQISEVLIKCSEMFTGEEKLASPLNILKVTCLSKPNSSGEPLRTKCWKVQVPNKFCEHMLKDEAYPYGWSHRRFFTKRNEHNVPAVDPAPKRQHLLSEAASAASGPGSSADTA